jgi:hypothetical protein
VRRQLQKPAPNVLHTSHEEPELDGAVTGQWSQSVLSVAETARSASRIGAVEQGDGLGLEYNSYPMDWDGSTGSGNIQRYEDLSLAFSSTLQPDAVVETPTAAPLPDVYDIGGFGTANGLGPSSRLADSVLDAASDDASFHDDDNGNDDDEAKPRTDTGPTSA